MKAYNFGTFECLGEDCTWEKAGKICDLFQLPENLDQYEELVPLLRDGWRLPTADELSLMLSLASSFYVLSFSEDSWSENETDPGGYWSSTKDKRFQNNKNEIFLSALLEPPLWKGAKRSVDFFGAEEGESHCRIRLVRSI